MSYAEQVAEAVADPEWQKFRLGLKHTPTEHKLRQLQLYYAVNSDKSSTTRRLQVHNYLTALARGGLIMVSNDYIGDLLTGKLRVKR